MKKVPHHIRHEKWTENKQPWNGTFEGRSIGTDITILNYTFEKAGDGPKWHVHTYDEIFLIRSGRALFTVGDQKIEAEEGDIVFGPAHVPHKYSSLGPKLLETTDIHLSDRFEQTLLDDPEIAEV